MTIILPEANMSRGNYKQSQENLAYQEKQQFSSIIGEDGKLQFGKHKGKLLSEAPKGYQEWILSKLSSRKNW